MLTNRIGLVIIGFLRVGDFQVIDKQVVVKALDKDDDGGFRIGDVGKVVSVDNSGCEVLFKHDKLPFYLYHWQIEEVK